MSYKEDKSENENKAKLLEMIPTAIKILQKEERNRARKSRLRRDRRAGYGCVRA